VAQAYGSHWAAEGLVMGLCWDYKLRGEEAAVVEASLVVPQIGIDKVLVMSPY
jgi:hypothetical protein